ncbi:hypothetical protein [Actinomadura rayongensis]|uniref:Uncharacterized protein n=1 Tax=Actinomadura rayongensis TaxID=1429076 RepID=A0A6I4W398_9ACTN|nr:hypothetical protein [Actinomadura rayongensis]MXQ65149.1 hypothetical protein [Actinomadura rayongensis]
MDEKRDAWATLRAAGFLHAAREAHREATLAVFGGMSRSAGFKERSFGTSSFDVLESWLDRVFGIDDDEPGPIVRDDLNNSPGWRCGRYRVLLKRHRFGAVNALRWDRDSRTKQAVARQEFADDPQLALEIPGVPADTPGIVTLVLAHSATEEPLQLELYLGRPRFNDDGGGAWHWVRALDDASLGADPRRKLVEPTLPLWTDDAADVVLRRRRATSTETAW